jgi:4-hydroxymandelate oxidase
MTLADYEAAAEQVLPTWYWDFIAGGAEDEVTVADNLAAFRRWWLVPRVLTDVAERELATTVLGQPIALPVLIGPSTTQRVAHPDGDLATARAAGKAGTVHVVASLAGYRIDEVAAEAAGPLWFQLYTVRDRETTAAMIRRAEEAGCQAVVVTLTAFYHALQERGLRNPAVWPADAWSANVYRVPGVTAPAGLDADEVMVPLTWADIEWLRSLTSMRIVLKGIVNPWDAALAVEHGVDAVIVSNHGGRQLDRCIPTLEALPGVVEAAAGRTEVYFDGGIRRGSDVVTALALGARAVLLGRPVLWGLAVNGEFGVLAILEQLRREIDNALAQLGRRSIHELDGSCLKRASG